MGDTDRCCEARDFICFSQRREELAHAVRGRVSELLNRNQIEAEGMTQLRLVDVL